MIHLAYKLIFLKAFCWSNRKIFWWYKSNSCFIWLVLSQFSFSFLYLSSILPLKFNYKVEPQEWRIPLTTKRSFLASFHSWLLRVRDNQQYPYPIHHMKNNSYQTNIQSLSGGLNNSWNHVEMMESPALLFWEYMSKGMKWKEALCMLISFFWTKVVEKELTLFCLLRTSKAKGFLFVILYRTIGRDYMKKTCPLPFHTPTWGSSITVKH